MKGHAFHYRDGSPIEVGHRVRLGREPRACGSWRLYDAKVGTVVRISGCFMEGERSVSVGEVGVAWATASDDPARMGADVWVRPDELLQVVV
jgi:hypothetical protein